MKHNKLLVILIVILTEGIGACKKEKVDMVNVASLKLVNVVAGGSTVFLGNSLTPVFNPESDNFALKTDKTDIYIWPEGDSLHPYYRSDKPITIADGDVYTIFLAGTHVAPESILVKESLPYHADSVAGIRFIHLSPGVSEVNVTLSESPDINEFANVSYRGITEFKTFPAGMANARYTFEVRDAISNSVLAEISMSGTNINRSVPRFKNTTLIFQGQIGGLGITRVNHY